MNTILKVFLLFTCLVLCQSLICRECSCTREDLSGCSCNSTSDDNDGSSCIIIEQEVQDGTQVSLSRLRIVSSYITIEDTYLILSKESIIYNESSSEWYTETNEVFFACDWDLCNDPTYIDGLPKSFELNISSSWLQDNIYGEGSVTNCFECSSKLCGNASGAVSDENCPLADCNGTSIVRIFSYDS